MIQNSDAIWTYQCRRHTIGRRREEAAPAYLPKPNTAESKSDNAVLAPDRMAKDKALLAQIEHERHLGYDE
jgi:hypothetical protein